MTLAYSDQTTVNFRLQSGALLLCTDFVDSAYQRAVKFWTDFLETGGDLIADLDVNTIK